MAFSNGVYTRVANSFSNPVANTTISPTDADTTFDDFEASFNKCNTKDLFANVSTQFDKASSATLADVTGLSVTLTASKIYSFEVVLFTSGTAAGGVKASMSGTVVPTSIIYEGHTITGGGFAYFARTDTIDNPVSAVTGVSVATIKMFGLITVTTGGTLTVKFAQNVASGTSSVLVGSFMRVFAHT